MKLDDIETKFNLGDTVRLTKDPFTSGKVDKININFEREPVTGTMKYRICYTLGQFNDAHTSLSVYYADEENLEAYNPNIEKLSGFTSDDLYQELIRRHYFAGTVGTITEETMKKYNQALGTVQ